MGVTVTVHDVPAATRDELGARAARAGVSLQDYLHAMLVRSAGRPPVEDVLARARSRVEATSAPVDAASIHAASDADRHRDRHATNIFRCTVLTP